MKNKITEFTDWLNEKLNIKCYVFSDSDSENRQFGKFNIFVSEDHFKIWTSNYFSLDTPKESYNKILDKLADLSLLNYIKSIDLEFTESTISYLNDIQELKELFLHKDIHSVDLSTYTNIKCLNLTGSADSYITFPRSLDQLNINLRSESVVKAPNFIKMFEENSLRAANFSFNQPNDTFDLTHLNLTKLESLSLFLHGGSQTYVGDALPSLKEITVYGSFDDSRSLVSVKPPKTIKKFTALDCMFEDTSLLKGCDQLTRLVLVDTNIGNTELTECLSQCSIEDLTLSAHNSTEADIEKWNLSQTKEIRLSRTTIESLSFLSHTNKLELLQADGCGITELPNTFPDSLKSLSLRHNDISNLPETIPPQLSFANFEHCSLVNIPKQYLSRFSIVTASQHGYVDHDNLPNTLCITGNSVENPPLEILKGSKSNIQSYIKSMVGETTQLNEAKIIFVGDGGVGKTSLMKRLVRDEFDDKESQTDGIEIEPYKVDLGEEGIVNASIWDFGGQQILQATHQLFLSKRSIYVLVVEDRKNDKHKDQDIEQWLTQINSLGGRPPILVVKNKIDENPNSDIQTQKLKTKFPNIVGFFEVSCDKRTGLERLDIALTECVRTLTMRKIALPRNWLNVKKQLKEQACSHDLLYLNTYKEICEQNDIHDRFAKDTLLGLLHDLGAVIAFEELKSHNTAILNPHWITEGVYAIIRSEVLAENNGVITLEDAQNALDNYSKHNRFEDKASYILDAMRNFELCHITEETNTYLIPALLPPQINLDTAWIELEHEEHITFLFRFEHLMPPPLIPMFLVKMHSHIVGEQRWRSGAIISPSHLDARALVDADKVTREIKLTIMGEERRDLLILLRAEINGLSSRLADIDEIGLQELIALDDSGETIGYDELIGLKRMGKNDFPVGKLNKMFSVSQLLGEIEPPADTEKALKTLMESSGNGLIHLHMTQKNENIATGGAATNHVTANNTNTNNNTATAEVKQDFRALKGQAEFVLEDIRYEIEGLTSSDRQLKDYATKECDKVERAINELEKNVDSQETADENLRHFSRIQNFLEGALKKTNSVGKVIDKAGDVYNEVGKLATKFNSIAEKFGIPTTVVLTSLGLG
ncbi:COR domain-containing protein [Vibrio lentus]|uniref:COR domain-containing protein n=1 Tax=Vibrio lentus TaxID=136468 RepID=UPI000C82A533|nr:COR domain-containing protein [Vibrio lentus]PML06262.1 hypothetical protein BCT85_05645 [Vibrio lentus]